MIKAMCLLFYQTLTFVTTAIDANEESSAISIVIRTLDGKFSHIRSITDDAINNMRNSLKLYH